MALVRRLVELGRAARAESGVKTRQPLSRALVAAHGLRRRSPADLRAQIAEELNVGSLRVARRGRRLPGRHHRQGELPGAGQAVRQGRPGRGAAIAAADAAALSRWRCATGTATVEVDGEPVTLGPDEVIITETPREGWAVASDAGATVALDLDDHAGAAPGRPGP